MNNVSTPVAVFERSALPTPREVGRIWFDGTTFQSTGFSPTQVDEIMNHVVILEGRRYTPADGGEFVRMLPVAFNGSYYWARLEPAALMEELRRELATPTDQSEATP